MGWTHCEADYSLKRQMLGRMQQSAIQESKKILVKENAVSGLVPSRLVLELGDAISGISRVPGQAARSIG
jgi:hypothetical protein